APPRGGGRAGGRRRSPARPSSAPTRAPASRRALGPRCPSRRRGRATPLRSRRSAPSARNSRRRWRRAPPAHPRNRHRPGRPAPRDVRREAAAAPRAFPGYGSPPPPSPGLDPGRQCLRLNREEPRHTEVGERQQPVQLLTTEGRTLRRPLDLDEAPVVGAHPVEVGVGGGGLQVAEVEARLPPREPPPA